MNQIEHDLKYISDILASKISFYTKVKDSITSQETSSDKAKVANEKIVLDRYLSYCYGRIRCYKMNKMKREDCITAYKEFLESKKEMLQDMQVYFKESGVV